MNIVYIVNKKIRNAYPFKVESEMYFSAKSCLSQSSPFLWKAKMIRSEFYDKILLNIEITTIQTRLLVLFHILKNTKLNKLSKVHLLKFYVLWRHYPFHNWKNCQNRYHLFLMHFTLSVSSLICVASIFKGF